jgi:hypothetical protein
MQVKKVLAAGDRTIRAFQHERGPAPVPPEREQRPRRDGNHANGGLGSGWYPVYIADLQAAASYSLPGTTRPTLIPNNYFSWTADATVLSVPLEPNLSFNGKNRRRQLLYGGHFGTASSRRVDVRIATCVPVVGHERHRAERAVRPVCEDDDRGGIVRDHHAVEQKQ